MHEVTYGPFVVPMHLYDIEFLNIKVMKKSTESKQ